MEMKFDLAMVYIPLAEGGSGIQTTIISPDLKSIFSINFKKLDIILKFPGDSHNCLLSVVAKNNNNRIVWYLVQNGQNPAGKKHTNSNLHKWCAYCANCSPTCGQIGGESAWVIAVAYTFSTRFWLNPFSLE